MAVVLRHCSLSGMSVICLCELEVYLLDIRCFGQSSILQPPLSPHLLTILMGIGSALCWSFQTLTRPALP